MSSHSRVDGRSKVTVLSIGHTLSPRTCLPYIAVFPEHVVRVNLVGTLEIFRISNSSGEASV